MEAVCHTVLDSGFCVLMQCQTAGVARQSALVPRAFMVQELALRQAEEADRAWGANDASALTDAVQNARVCHKLFRGPLIADQLRCTGDTGFSSPSLQNQHISIPFSSALQTGSQGTGCSEIITFLRSSSVCENWYLDCKNRSEDILHDPFVNTSSSPNSWRKQLVELWYLLACAWIRYATLRFEVGGAQDAVEEHRRLVLSSLDQRPWAFHGSHDQAAADSPGVPDVSIPSSSLP